MIYYSSYGYIWLKICFNIEKMHHLKFSVKSDSSDLKFEVHCLQNKNIQQLKFQAKNKFSEKPKICLFKISQETLLLFHPADPQEITSGEVYQEFNPSDDIVRRSGAKGCSDHRFRAHRSYTAQLLLCLHQHRANNQYMTVNQI